MARQKIFLLGPSGINKFQISSALQDHGYLVLDFPGVGDSSHSVVYHHQDFLAKKLHISKSFPIDGFVIF